MCLVAVIEDPAVSEKILSHLGVWQRERAPEASRGLRGRDVRSAGPDRRCVSPPPQLAVEPVPEVGEVEDEPG
jgi:hypothetical protein